MVLMAQNNYPQLMIYGKKQITYFIFQIGANYILNPQYSYKFWKPYQSILSLQLRKIIFFHIAWVALMSCNHCYVKFPAKTAVWRGRISVHCNPGLSPVLREQCSVSNWELAVLCQPYNWSRAVTSVQYEQFGVSWSDSSPAHQGLQLIATR